MVDENATSQGGSNYGSGGNLQSGPLPVVTESPFQITGMLAPTPWLTPSPPCPLCLSRNNYMEKYVLTLEGVCCTRATWVPCLNLPPEILQSIQTIEDVRRLGRFSELFYDAYLGDTFLIKRCARISLNTMGWMYHDDTGRWIMPLPGQTVLSDRGIQGCFIEFDFLTWSLKYVQDFFFQFTFADSLLYVNNRQM
ncbi:unnamed protein product [Soboliphyme baturini]|uniref:NOT2_3_5 domain-containing protein n=1 Tax=Soboliphyme baturini TaxID=241478 RepID=A0A183I9A9_9BILA|nr:unnamed protein product [Soboliphyme baturini]